MIWLGGFILGGFMGWVIAHNVIAHECKIRESFYVGKEDFKCTLIERTGS